MKSRKRRSLTREKLAEAEFFFKKVKATFPRRIGANFYLSAFINAARSIPWIMRAEYKNTPGWEKWYGSVSLTTTQNELLAEFRELRNLNQKVRPTSVGRRLRFKGLSNDPALSEFFKKQKPGTKIRWSMEIGGDKKTEISDKRAAFPAILKSSQFEILDSGSTDAVRSCSQYLKLLAQLVAQCTKRFGVPKEAGNHNGSAITVSFPPLLGFSKSTKDAKLEPPNHSLDRPAAR